MKIHPEYRALFEDTLILMSAVPDDVHCSVAVRDAKERIRQRMAPLPDGPIVGEPPAAPARPEAESLTDPELWQDVQDVASWHRGRGMSHMAVWADADDLHATAHFCRMHKAPSESRGTPDDEPPPSDDYPGKW